MLKNVVLVSLLLAASACQSPSAPVNRLAAYDAAIACADFQKPKPPKVFVAGQCADTFWQELVPYCEQARSRSGRSSIDHEIEWALRTMVREMPDAVWYGEGDTQMVGSVNAYVGSSLKGTVSKYSTRGMLIAYREAPSEFPFRWNPAGGMVRMIRDPAKAGGLQEGDSLLLIGEFEATSENCPWPRSPLHRERMSMKPGDKVRAVWIRPGQGRMTGEVEMLPSQRTYLKQPDSAAVRLDGPYWSKAGDGRPFWYYQEPEQYDQDGAPYPKPPPQR